MKGVKEVKVGEKEEVSKRLDSRAEAPGRKPKSQGSSGETLSVGVLFELRPRRHVYDCRKLMNTLTIQRIFKSV